MDNPQGPERRGKVLLVITKVNWGGAQRYVYDVTTELKDTYDVAVAFGDEGSTLEEKLREAGVRTKRVPGLANTSSPLRLARMARILVHLFADERPNLVHLNSSVAGIAGAVAARIAGVPRIVFTAHGWAFNEDRSYLARLAIKALHWVTVLLAHRTIAVSEAMKQQMNWPFADAKISVVHNGSAPLSFLPREEARARLVERVPELARYVNDVWTGTIAELHPVKRHEVMLDALADVVRTHRNVRHVIMGDGQLRDALRERVAELGLSEHVFFAGHVPEAATHLRALDVFTLTSRSEAFAYVLLEAGMAGLPVLATRVGAVPELVSHEATGLLVEPDDPANTARALAQLLDDPALQATYGEKLKQAVSERFTLARMLDGTRAVYESTRDA